MSANDIYKKDKAIIKELLKTPGYKFGMGYSIAALVMTLIMLIIDMTDNIEFEMTSMAMTLMGYMIMIGMIMVLNGTTVFAGEKAAAQSQARATVKGAYNQMPTFMCIPIRHESLFRFQFERLILFMLVPSVYSVIVSVCSFVSEKVITVDIFLSVLTVFLVSFSVFIINYGIVFKSKKVKKALVVFYGAAVILMSVIMLITTFGRLFMEELGGSVLFIGVPFQGGNIAMLVMAAAFPLAAYIIYKNVILKKTGGGWYE
ncbi:MAG: hypothetical protein IJZ72_08015 [Oscillospiraceae bacterium]|nr:hypothetical protein [Oscillospiraceae bacterium]